MKQAKTRRGIETRDRILTAAAELIHERGVTGISVDDILAASGTGKSSSTSTSRARTASFARSWATTSK